MESIAIDIGNTRIKVGFFNEDSLTEVKYFPKMELMLSDILDPTIPAVVGASGDINLLKFTKDQSVLIVDAKTDVPLDVDYKTLDSLGVDRLAAAIAAAEKGKRVMVVDFGTCITVEFISSDKIYQGGYILPGVDMRLRSMNQYTDKLPYFQNWRELWVDLPLVGKSTQECLLCGVKQSVIMEIQGWMNQLNNEAENTKVIFTGGDAPCFDKEFKNSIFAEPNLVLKGLNKILLHNI